MQSSLQKNSLTVNSVNSDVADSAILSVAYNQQKSTTSGESFITAGNASTQSLFIPMPLRRSSSNSTAADGSLKSGDKLEFEGLISILDEDEQLFEDYKAEYYLHSLALTSNIEELEEALTKIESIKELESRDLQGRTVLHCAASFHGDSKKCIQLILESYKYLIKNHTTDRDTIYANFVNMKDVYSQTALYLAAKYENVKVCKELIANNADWDVKTNRGKTPILKMFKKTPQVIKKTLLKFATKGSNYANKQESIVKLDFGPIIGYPSDEENESNSNWIYEETHLLSNICHTREKDKKLIIDNILVKIFIWLKWRKFKFCFWLIVVLPILRLLLYFWFLIRVYRKDCPYPTEEFIEFSWGNLRSAVAMSSETDDDATNLTSSLNSTNTLGHCYKNAVVTYIGWHILIISILDVLFFEVYPTFITFRRLWYPIKTKTLWKYTKRTYLFLKILSIGQYVEFVAIFLNILPALGWPIFDPGTEWQYIIASIGVFFAWFHIFHQLGRIPPLTVYVKMFGSVLATLVDVSFMYGAIICAFAMVFCILLPGVGSYSSLTQALLKIPTFLIGEIEYEDIFYGENAANVSASLSATMIFYVMAILVLHVALLNFLVGLTVADIQRVHDDREILKNCCKIWQIYMIETFLSCAPKRWGVPLLKYMRVQTGRKICDTDGFVIQLHIKEIPKHLQKELRELFAQQKDKMERKLLKCED